MTPATPAATAATRTVTSTATSTARTTPRPATARRRRLTGRGLDAALLVAGIALAVWSVREVLRAPGLPDPVLLLAVPLIALVARFPVVTDQGDGGIEIGFDSAVLMFLACLVPPWTALATWSLGVVLTQLGSRRRPRAVLFNIGVGICAGAAATGVLHLLAGDDTGLRELLAVLLAAATYFTADYVLSGVSLALQAGSPVHDTLAQSGTWLAIGCFVPVDLLGYLGAVMARTSPWWTLLLLAAPLGTLLVATRAISHGRENARRLQVLLDAAIESQTLAEDRRVLESLVTSAERLLHIHGVEVRHEAPGIHEVGTMLRGTAEVTWLVSPARTRARSSPAADLQALRALVAVSSAAFDRLALTDDLVHLARYDPLTDLPNRAVFLDRLNYALMMARRGGHRVALLMVDLDGFKQVNDRFGHAEGDAVLVDVARRLRSGVREQDVVARLGGDEFAVLLEDVGTGELQEVCERLLATVSAEPADGAQPVHVGASIGVATGDGERHADEMLRNADLAMYQAKAQGKNRYVHYEPAMLALRLQRLELVEALREALEKGDLTLAYQPVTVAATGRIVGAEALARWRRGGTHVSPGLFIPLAEETGLVTLLGRVVLEQVVRDAPAVRAAGGDGIHLAVNISPSQLGERDFVPRVADAVARMGRTGLVLEITEREGIAQDSTVAERMAQATALGARFAIDDFGVGFSSLSYLREVPAQIVKVDASLSQNIDHDAQARGLLRSITMMSQALGHEVVIEGIERSSQLDVVREDVAGAHVQGYLLHHPMPLDQLVAVLTAERAASAS